MSTNWHKTLGGLGGACIIVLVLCIVNNLYKASKISRPPSSITFDKRKQIVRSYTCDDEDIKLRAKFEVECVGDDVRLGDMCRRYSAELFCEVSYD